MMSSYYPTFFSVRFIIAHCTVPAPCVSSRAANEAASLRGVNMLLRLLTIRLTYRIADTFGSPVCLRYSAASRETTCCLLLRRNPVPAGCRRAQPSQNTKPEPSLSGSGFERRGKGAECSFRHQPLAAAGNGTQRTLPRRGGTPDGIRTHDLQSRSLTLYPAELRAHI